MTVSEVTTTLIGSLKSQPLVIGLLLINIVFLGAVSLAVHEVRQQDHTEMRLLLERCLPARG